MKNLKSLVAVALLSASYLAAAHPGALDTTGMNAAQKARVAAHQTAMAAHIAGLPAATPESAGSLAVLNDATLFNGTIADNAGTLEGNIGGAHVQVLPTLQAGKDAADALDALHNDADATIATLKRADELATLAAVRKRAIDATAVVEEANAKFGREFLSLAQVKDAATAAALMSGYAKYRINAQVIPVINAYFARVDGANVDAQFKHGAGNAILQAGDVAFEQAALKTKLEADVDAVVAANAGLLASLFAPGINAAKAEALSTRVLGLTLKAFAEELVGGAGNVGLNLVTTSADMDHVKRDGTVDIGATPNGTGITAADFAKEVLTDNPTAQF